MTSKMITPSGCGTTFTTLCNACKKSHLDFRFSKIFQYDASNCQSRSPLSVTGHGCIGHFDRGSSSQTTDLSRKVDREKKGFLGSHRASEGLARRTTEDRVHSPSIQSKFPSRLIDINKECMVEKYEECTSVALSYVWDDLLTLGNMNRNKNEIPIHMTLREDIEDMKVGKNIFKSRLEPPSTGRIPQTIRDAMESTTNRRAVSGGRHFMHHTR
ncbi:hypothetical protein F5B19DRAFT_440764 [Rostrohypoxylon terebratum]|nr:hypothetical protein F5B19DRAFT_440764 [Rostrohypoxylon terebratum]